MYVTAILSALFLSSAWYFAWCSALLYVIGLCLFSYSMMVGTYKTLKEQSICAGLWSFIFFSIHFSWLLFLLLTKSNASMHLSCTIYITVVGIVATISTTWILCAQAFIKKLIFLPSLLIFFMHIGVIGMLFYILENCLLLFCEGGRYRPLFFLLPFFLHSVWWNNKLDHYQNRQPIIVSEGVAAFYLKPSYAIGNPHQCGDELFRSLYELHLERHENQFKNLLIFAPESSFPFPLNDYPEIVSLWSCLLPHNACLCIGALRKEDVKVEESTQNIDKNKVNIFQTVFFIKNRRITEHYDKHFPTPFCEKLPSYAENKLWMQNIFLKGSPQFATSPHDQKLFHINDTLILRPLICADAFLHTPTSLENSLTCIFCNDSWFIKPAQQWMRAIISAFSYYRHERCLFISHNSMNLIE